MEKFCSVGVFGNWECEPEMIFLHTIEFGFVGEGNKRE